jgi:hypothetical protein
MMLDFPGVVDTELVGDSTLLERSRSNASAPSPRPRQLVLVENAELHGRSRDSPDGIFN